MLFPGLDATTNRLLEPDMDTIMSEALAHMQTHNDTVAKADRMTREEFAEYIMIQLGTQNPPIGYPLHDRFDELWA